MKTLLVEAPDVEAEGVLELATTEDQESVEALRPHAAEAFREGIRVGCLDRRPDDSIPSLAKIASKARLNFVSRSWIKNRGRPARSSRSIRRLRACCVIQAASGWRVQARYSTLARAYSSTFFSTSGDPSAASRPLRSPLSGPRAETGAR